jgi:glycosyltransferase involved in cell wall biosynthesis
MKKLAIIDLLFNWPPEGGARIDIKEVATRLSGDLDVRMFVADFQLFSRRGDVREPLDFKIVRIPFDRFSFNFYQVPFEFLKTVEKWRPDYVMIADGWFLKPYLTLAFQDYSPIVRFYAYENLCLRSHGVLFVNGALCPIDFSGGTRRDVATCIACGKEMFNDRLDNAHGQEFYAALANSIRYRDTVVAAFSAAGRLICNNKLIADRLVRFNPNVSVIPAGVDTDLFCPDQANRNGSGGSSKIIFMPGRADDPVKGFEILLEAGKLLRKKRQDFEIWFTSVLPLHAGPDYIKNLGWLNPAELPSIYRASTFCVIPSLWAEPFGIITLEAMACGKPAIVTNRGGLMETVINGETGLILPAGEVNPLLEAMDDLLDRPDEVQRLGDNARRRVVDHYQWETIMDRWYRPLFNIPQ